MGPGLGCVFPRPLPSEARGLRSTHHNLRQGLQCGLELVGRRQGVWQIHGPGQDEQRSRDLLVQV